MDRDSNLPSIFYQNLAGSDTPQADRRALQPVQGAQQSAQSQSQGHYPTLPRANTSPLPNYAQGGSLRGQRQAQYSQSAVALPSQSAQPTSTDSLKPIPRAARTVNDNLALESRYPELDNVLIQGQSSEYDLTDSEWAPFVRTNVFDIPDQIFEQYNQVQVVTKMGLFAEIGRAWITVDNRLYLWNFSSGDDFQTFEEQPHSILAVNLLKPKPGVFVDSVTHVLLVATTQDIFLLGVSAVPNGRPYNGRDLTIYNTKMSVPVKSINVNVIEGSEKTGRIFFTGTGDNEVYELTYQEQEGWFQPRCGKICHTQPSMLAQFAPKIPFLSGPTSTEHTIQMIVDDSRSLLYTLSSNSTIRTFHMKGSNILNLAVISPFQNTLTTVRMMLGNSPIISRETQIVSISTIAASEAKRLHLAAITSSGCRLYFSAVGSEYAASGAEPPAPANMQVLHVRFPPAVDQGGPGQPATRANPTSSRMLLVTRKACIFPPGYFLCFVDHTGEAISDSLFLSSPDSARIGFSAEQMQGKSHPYETAHWVDLESRVEAVQLLTAPFAAAATPAGFGNEMAVQFDQAPTEIAVLTNSGIHIIKRRRYVEILASAIRFGASSAQSTGVEGEVRRFFESYGRSEGCATSLAVACGVLSSDSYDTRAIGKVTDIEVADYARKYFIEFGGKARVEHEYDVTSVPSLDSVRVSGRHEGIAVYISRIVRSIWRNHVILTATPAPGAFAHATSVPVPKLQIIQEHLQRLSEFLSDNRSYIEGLSGAESLMRLGSRVEEVAQQAEHRALYSLVQLVSAMVEGISFVLALLDDKLDDVISLLPDETKNAVRKLTFEELFTADSGRNIAKDLVTAMVNRNIAAGSSVDAVADNLRKRCGSFCSADDVVTFKAIENLRRAKELVDADSRQRILRESERLFEQVAGTLTLENLNDAMNEFGSLQFSAGAIRLALSVAKETDRGNQALSFLHDGMPEMDPRADSYKRRLQCYDLIFPVLDQVDSTAAKSPPMIDGQPTRAAELQHEAYAVVYSCEDELFQSCLFDWFFSRGWSEKLLAFDGAAIIPYLQRSGTTSLSHADLLWQYYSRRESFYDAAMVLRELAMSDFSISLEKRIEYLSRARGLSNCYCPIGTRQAMNDLLQRIQDEMDVAVIQDEILRRVTTDPNRNEKKMIEFIEQLDGKLLDMTDLFNRFADPFGYWDICLQIFQGADYRGTHEIKGCWEKLLKTTTEAARTDNSKDVYVVVADTVRTLGQRFSLSEYIFPPEDLVPMLENWAMENAQDSMGTSWVPQIFLDVGVSPELLMRILDAMFYRDEVPFRGSNRKALVRDSAHVAERWQATAQRKRGKSTIFGSSGEIIEGGFKKQMALNMLGGYKKILTMPIDAPLMERLERLSRI